MSIAVGISIMLFLATALNPASERALAFAEKAMEHLPWPMLALWVLVAYRVEITSLLERITEIAGAKFAAPKQDGGSSEKLAPATQLTGEPSASDQQRPATAVVSPSTVSSSLALGTPIVTTESAKTVDTSNGDTNGTQKSFFELEQYPPVEHYSIQLEMNRLIALNRELAKLSRVESEGSLIYQLAVAGVLSDFQVIAKVIYGSQFRLLKAIYSSVFQEAEAKNWMDGGWSTESREGFYGEWIGYLVARGLVYRERDGSVTATAKGKDFVDWEQRTAQNLAKRPG